ncbi:hypothetical protein [Helicobacter sp. 23-1046]
MTELPWKSNIIAFPLSRKDFINRWLDLDITVSEYISKVLLIVDDNARKVWLKELDSKAKQLCQLKAKGKLSNTIYEIIYTKVCFENQYGLQDYIFTPLVEYIESPRNKTKSALLREYELVEFEKDMNAFLCEFIEIVKFYKETQDKAHKSGALQKTHYQRNHCKIP